MREIYVGVGAVDAPHSGIWKLWTQGDDFYATHVLAGSQVAKVSVHASGVCRYASVGEFDHDWDRDKDPRVLHRWRIAKVGTVPWCPCFILMVPTVFIPKRTDLTQRLRQRHLNRTVWVQAAPLGHATNIECLRIEDPRTPLEEVLKGDYDVLGSLALRSGAVIWVYASREAIPREDAASWQKEIAAAIVTVEEENPDGAFGTLSSAAEYHVPIIRELALGDSNFRFVRPPSPRPTRERSSRA